MKRRQLAKEIHRGEFGEGKVSKLILNQALPLLLAQFVQLLYNIVDRIYIGHMPFADSATVLSGLGVCFPIVTLIASCVNWVSAGAAPLCSMSRGKKDRHKASLYLSTAFTLQVYFSLALIALVYITKTPLLYLLGASEDTFGYANEYLNIYVLGTLFFAVGTGMNSFINLQGFPKIGMFTTIIGAIINLILDPIFIFGLRLGIRGAAYATLISQFVAAVWVLSFLGKSQRELRLSFLGRNLDLKTVKEILTLGFAGFTMGATNCLAQAVCNSTLSVFGGDLYIGIMTIINSVREVVMLPITGITGGAQPVVSYNYGAKKISRVKQGIVFTSVMGLIYTAIFWLSTLVLPHFYLSIFSNEQELITMGMLPLRVYFMGFVFMGLQFSGQSTFTALGKSKQAIFFACFRKLVIVIPLTLLLPLIPSVGYLGVFLAEPVSNFVSGTICFLWMYFTVYRELKE